MPEAIIHGKIAKIEKIEKENKIVKLKPIKILSNVCPAIIFANNRIDKLKSRAIYETISIKTNKIAIAIGVPLGKKNPINRWNPLLYIARIFIINNKIKAVAKVITNELVIVKLYGINPIMFENKIIKNIK